MNKFSALSRLLRVSKWRHDFFHHLFVATVLACSILLAETFTPWLNWLDSVALRLALPAASTGQITDPDAQPKIVVISDELYERAFEQSSPLNRARLAELLEKIAAGKPKVLVIDLDLSPSARDVAHPIERIPLDTALFALARNTQIVLPLPFRTATLSEEQHAWIRKMCEEGIFFARPTLTSSFNTVVRHEIESPLLANVATQLRAGGGPLVNEQASHLCHLATSLDAEPFFEAAQHEHSHGVNTIPLKTSLLSPINLHQQLIPLGWSEQHGFSISGVTGKTVFLGGAWADTDTFVTAISDRAYPGVFIHAAAYSTLLNPVKNTSHGQALLVDICIGTFLGFLFHFTWQLIQNLKRNLLKSHASLRKCLAKVFIWRLLILSGWLPPILIVYVFFGMSAFLLNWNIWLNPGPLVFGMFIDAIMAAKTHEDSDGEHHHEFHLKRIFHFFPDLGWQIPFVGFTVFTIYFVGH